MEGVTVGQVFDAECILSKRPRKVSFPRAEGLREASRLSPNMPPNMCVFVSAGEVWIPGEMERMVLKVSS